MRNKRNGQTIKTNAALDNRSTSSYMNNELLNDLNIKTRETTLSIKTIESKETDIKVAVVNDLELLRLMAQI